jgi:hypothetical protein
VVHGRTKHRAIAARSNAKDLAYLLNSSRGERSRRRSSALYRFAEIPLAMDYAQKGHAEGKLVIDYEEE